MVAVRKIGEGEYFGVPLPDGGFGVGLVARTGRKGILLGYFSGVYHQSLPTVGVAAFTAEEAVWIELFGDLGFVEGRWPILGASGEWRRESWPFPDFAHHEELTGRCYRISFNGDLRRRPERSLVSPEDVFGLPEYGVAGAQFVEMRLQGLLLPGK